MCLLAFVVIALGILAATLAQPRTAESNVASARQFPFQAALIAEANWCGGVLISREWILTSAQCIEGTKTLVAILGAQDIEVHEENQVRVEISMGSVFLHEDWERGSRVNDIAAVGLPFPVELSDYIKPVYLPRVSSGQLIFEGLDATTSGWSYYISNELHYGLVKISKQSACLDYFPEGDVDESIVCLEAASDICLSDLGSPLVLNDASGTLIGLASFGWASKCTLGEAALFTRITSHVRWIYETTGVINNRF